MNRFSRNGLGTDDEDRLPWLEAVEEFEDEGTVDIGRLIAALIAALLAIGLIVGGIFWIRNRSETVAEGDGSIIKAPDVYYKERPQKPGGLASENADGSVYGASQGNEVASAIDLTVPERPVNQDDAADGRNVWEAMPPATRPANPVVAAPVAKPVPPKPTPAPTARIAARPSVDAIVPTKVAPPVAKPVPPKPKAASLPAPAAVRAGGNTLQLGAFSTESKANAVWKTLSGRFGFLNEATYMVVPVAAGEKTLYRLRASAPGQAGTLCAKLKVAGESCSVIE